MGKANSQLACWEVSRGQGRTLQPSRPHLQPLLSPWHGQMPTAHQPSRQALSPTTWGSQSATTRGGDEAEVPAQVPSVSCPQSWGRSPAGGLEQNIRFRGGGRGGVSRRLAGPRASSGAPPGTQLEPGPKTVVPHRRAGVRREVSSWGLVCDQCRVPSGSLRQHYAAGLQRGLGGHPGPLGTPARQHVADPLYAFSPAPLSVPPPALSLFRPPSGQRLPLEYSLLLGLCGPLLPFPPAYGLTSPVFTWAVFPLAPDFLPGAPAPPPPPDSGQPCGPLQPPP